MLRGLLQPIVESEAFAQLSSAEYVHQIHACLSILTVNGQEKMFEMLFGAILRVQTSLVPSLLQFVTPDTSMTLMQCACRFGYIEIARLCLDHASPLVVEGSQCFHPLSLAYKENHLNIVQLILSKCGLNDILQILTENSACIGGVFDLICDRDDASMLILLLQRLSQPAQNQILSSDEYKFFHRACLKRAKSVVMTLFAICPNLLSGRYDWSNAIEQNDSSILTLFLDKLSIANARLAYDIVCKACRYGRNACVNQLLSRGVNVNYAMRHNDRSQVISDLPLEIAFANNNSALVRILLEHGAKLSSPLSRCCSEVQACRLYYSAMQELGLPIQETDPQLIYHFVDFAQMHEYGISINGMTGIKHHQNALRTYEMKINCFRDILSGYGCNNQMVEFGNKDWASFIISLSTYNSQAISVLAAMVEMGISTPQSTTADARAPSIALKYACAHHYWELVEFALSCDGCNFEVDQNAIWMLSQGGLPTLQVMTRNIENGIHGKNSAGETLLTAACQALNTSVVRLLLQAGADPLLSTSTQFCRQEGFDVSVSYCNLMFVVVHNLTPQTTNQEYEKVRELLLLLKEYGVDPRYMNAIGATCIDYLVIAGRLQLAAELLSPMMEVPENAGEAIARLWGKRASDIKMHLQIACIALVPRFVEGLLSEKRATMNLAKVSCDWIAQGLKHRQSYKYDEAVSCCKEVISMLLKAKLMDHSYKAFSSLGPELEEFAREVIEGKQLLQKRKIEDISST